MNRAIRYLCSKIMFTQDRPEICKHKDCNTCGWKLYCNLYKREMRKPQYIPWCCTPEEVKGLYLESRKYC